jgi:nucleoside-diphosphate-sugar epimerase
MAILLTGGTGKTSIRVARFLQNDNIPFLLASRRGQSAAPPGMPAVEFDWLDKDTWRIPFDYKFVNDQVITAIYLMEPQAPEPWKPLNEFIDYALEKHGVRRFVLVAGSSAECGKPGMGMVWQHFLDRQVDYCVLRPSWFMGEQPKDFIGNSRGRGGADICSLVRKSNRGGSAPTHP